MQGNPINVGAGNKVQIEEDYLGSGTFPLEFKRTYNSLYIPNVSSFGNRWSGTYDRQIFFRPGLSAATAVRSDGRVFKFTQNGSAFIGDPDVPDRLQQTLDAAGNLVGWEYDRADNTREQYDAGGKLIAETDINGQSHYLIYSDTATHYSIAPYPGMLIAVRDSRGREIRFSYDGKVRLASMTDPSGKTIEYGYDVNGNLVTRKAQDGSVREYKYNEPDNRGTQSLPYALTSIIGEDGARFATFKYDNDGRASSTEHMANADKVSVSYGANNTAIVTDALGASRTFTFTKTYDVFRLTSVQEPCPACVGGTGSRILTLDVNGYKDKSIDLAGVITDFDYDANGLEIKRVDAVNDASAKRTIETTWHTTARVPTQKLVKNAAGAVVSKSTWSYNSRGQVLVYSEVDPDTSAIRFTTTTYCEQADIDAGECPLLGLVTSVDGPRSDVVDKTIYSYYQSDAVGCTASPANCAYRKGDLWKITNALSQVITENTRYDGAGRIASAKDINGVMTDFEYGDRGWLSARKVRGADDSSEADDAVTRYDYFPTGFVKKITQADGSFIVYGYDAAHRLTSINDSLGNSITYTLNGIGRRIKEETKDAGGALRRLLSRGYNIAGQLESVTSAYGRTTIYAPDQNGRDDVTVDALGRKTDTDYDPLSRISKIVQDVGGVGAKSEFKFDALDRAISVTDPKSLVTTYTYNGLGDRVKIKSPDTGESFFTFDSAGNRKTETDARGITRTYLYDALNRPVAISFPTASLNIAYEYDTGQQGCDLDERFSRGRLTKITDSSGVTGYCYDQFGRVTQKRQLINGNNFAVRYGYTLSGRLKSITYPDGSVVDYVRDGQSRITQISVRRGGSAQSEIVVNQAAYYPFGQSAGWIYGNSRQMTRVVDLDYRVAQVKDAAAGGLSASLDFDWVGNVTKLNQNDSVTPTVTFDYDGLNRLTALRDGPSQAPIEAYGYDATGNRLNMTTAAGTQNYTYPATSHLLTQIGSTSARAYDANGNTTQIDVNSFVYNDLGRRSEVKQVGVSKARYTYNAKGEQVARTAGATTRYKVFGENGLWLGMYDETGKAMQQVIWLDDLPVGLLAEGREGGLQLSYIEPDHLGTPRVVVDSARNVPVWTWDLKSEAFGSTAPNQDPDQDGTTLVLDMRFPGQQYDSISDLNYNYFRDYDPSVGRYVQSDPIGLIGGVSTYAYVLSNPSIWTDPKGLFVVTNGNGSSCEGAIGITTCDGNGNLEVRNCNGTCTSACTAMHENNHARFLGTRFPGGCKDKPKGASPWPEELAYDQYVLLSAETECKAWAETMSCLKLLESALATGCDTKCRSDIESMKNGYKYWRKYYKCAAYSY
ncbi:MULTISPECIES: RHS repeat-associated core domain-containing protein [unclassified Lysobacter]|uniref:RHS repeat-associated core domain-containing protein n=1 Tax=unclassified Lysobacter TaxID=2635362 RepID=UPI001BECE41B|nr:MULTISPECIES: RHS repeat-associated core domain-containing protein [unclassified Lysobacter]MBT2747150.1 RHS repeat protein [Lysobacter sp. ISL-42]MBT2752956.1 RHS repeat protein [Lysobacter sp. ISL-50]MBT2778883.1 RHS repeat protein [Lysobacter sp. ISL-54]MBT2784223.1 RHS repeat protein [Lysobacter sp. ISL-52]